MGDCPIFVGIRCRPLMLGESEATGILSFEDDVVKVNKKAFYFDHVFHPEATNKDIYSIAVAEKLPFLFQGYNVTILAYGPTGSGKSYTMGTNYNTEPQEDHDVGVIPRGMNEIFKFIETYKNEIDFTIKISFLEIYAEDIYDLLQHSTPCTLREDSEGVNKVVNLKEIGVSSLEEAMNIFEIGSKARRSSATAKNVQSSRSHAIFSVYVEQTNKSTFDFKRAKFQLVDLAGSERINTSKTVGVQRKEGININLGLLSLAKVITHLIEEKAHIPYRESKLTRLLQDSLGGNSHTVMIACVNPSSTSIEETSSTIRYASNARKIENKPEVNMDPPEIQIEKLKKEVWNLKVCLRQAGSEFSSCTTVYPDAPSDKVYSKFHTRISNSYQEIESLKHKLTEAQKVNCKLVEDITYTYEKYRELIAEFTDEALTNTSLQVYVDKIKEAFRRCVQLMVKDDSDITTTDISEVSQCSTVIGSTETNESAESSKDGKIEAVAEEMIPPKVVQEETLEEVKENCKISNKKLEALSRSLNFKTSVVRGIKEFNRTLENVDTGKINTLLSQITLLSKEKEDLQENMKKVEKKFEMEYHTKITKYECEIQELKPELQRTKRALKMKEENKAKITGLENDIKDLKKKRVDLMKKVKEDNAKFFRLQKENDARVIMLLKEGKKKEVQFSKITSAYERQLTVLKQRIERANALNKRPISDIKDKSSSQYGQRKKFKPSLDATEIIKERVEEVMKILSCNNVTKSQIEMAEKDMEHLKKCLDEDSNLEANESDVEALKSKLYELAESIKEMKNTIDKKNEEKKISDLKDSIKSISDGKLIVEKLIEKIISCIVDTEKVKHSLEEEVKKESSNAESYEEKIKDLEKEKEDLIHANETLKLEHQEEVKQLQWENDTKILNLLSELHSAHSEIIHAETSSQLQERIDLQAEEIQRLYLVRENYEKKCKEIADMRRKMFKVKCSRKIRWLSDLDSEPPSTSIGSSGSHDEVTQSMLGEFLTASDEFLVDPKACDFLKSPVGKRQKIDTEMVFPSSPSDSISEIKICGCSGACDTQRCRCKEFKMTCSPSCLCKKAECSNLETCESTISFPKPTD